MVPWLFYLWTEVARYLWIHKSTGPWFLIPRGIKNLFFLWNYPSWKYYRTIQLPGIFKQCFYEVWKLIVNSNIASKQEPFYTKKNKTPNWWKASRAKIASRVYRQNSTKIDRIAVTYRRKNLACWICWKPTMLYIPCLWTFNAQRSEYFKKNEVLAESFCGRIPRKDLLSEICSLQLCSTKITPFFAEVVSILMYGIWETSIYAYE